MRMTAIHVRIERMRYDRSVRSAEKHRRLSGTEPLSGLFRPVSAARPTAGATRGKKRLSRGRIQAILAAKASHLGNVVDYGDTETVFTNPKVPRADDYVTGRFG